MTESEIAEKFKITHSTKLLDVGGSLKQLQEIKVDTLVDLVHPQDSPYHPSPLKAKKFVRMDIENDDLPFPDKYFDFCYCSHTLEDLYYPTRILMEMSRVAKRGLIITPSRGEDITFGPFNLTQWGTGARRCPGLPHHQWLFETDKNTLILTPKIYPLLFTPEFQIVNWRGEKENYYHWEEQLRFQQAKFTDIFAMISNYRDFAKRNMQYISKGLVAISLDSPLPVLKEGIKSLFALGHRRS